MPRRCQTLPRIADAWTPLDPPKCVDWVPANTMIPDTTETPGEFDLELFPHVLEVLELVDDPDVRLILMDWGTRNAKTFTTLSIGQYFARCWRAPMVFASSDESQCDEAIEDKFLPLLKACREPGLVRFSQKKGVFIDDYRIRKAYAGSPSTLAGYPARVLLGNEIGLWPINMVRRLIQRAKLFSFDSKGIFEGKPEIEGKCAITALVNAKSTQRRYRMVQCPTCKVYQRLFWNRDLVTGAVLRGAGIKWDDREKNPIDAANSAYYECVSGCRIDDAARIKMLRNGRWVPEGCEISKAGKISGKPLVPKKNVALTGLGMQYSLAVSGWSQVVQSWFDSENDEEARREFITGDLGLTYNNTPQRATAEAIARNLRAEDHQQRGVCPEWVKFLTTAADVGIIGETLVFYWMVCGWGSSEVEVLDSAGKPKTLIAPRGGVIDWGYYPDDPSDNVIETGVGFLRKISTLSYPHEDGGDNLPAMHPGQLGGIDSGKGAQEVYDLVDAMPNWHALKGDHANPKSVGWYWWGNKKVGQIAVLQRLKKKLGLGDLLFVNTHNSQTWRRSLARGRITIEMPNFVSLPAEICDDWKEYESFLEQFDADVQIDIRKWDNGSNPNEYGDTLRYCRSLAELHTRGGSRWDSLKRITSQPKKESKIKQRRKRRRGRNFATGSGGR